jgi:hypothetical protein
MTKLNLSAFASALVAVASLAGCSSSNTDSANGSCAIALTGAVTSNISCTLAVGAYSTATGQSAISLTTTSSTFALSVGFPGTVHTGTYHSTDAGAIGAITTAQGSSSWAAIPTAGAVTGSYTVSLTTVATLSTTAAGTGYSLHGTIDATLAPIAGTGSSSNVTLHATF